MPISLLRYPSNVTPTLWTMAFLGAGLLWAAMPPLDWWPLAWIAPIPWLLLIRRQQLTGSADGPDSKLGAMPTLAVGMPSRVSPGWLARGRQFLANLIHGRYPYTTLTLAGFAFWMGALHWLRLPDPATSIGWVALSIYFAFYMPTFVGLSRVAVHRLRVPVILAAPVVWTGLELARGRLLSGMTMGSLCHTQYRWTGLIQISDLAGAYGVSFVVMFVAASLARMVPLTNGDTAPSNAPPSRRRGLPTILHISWPLLPAAIVLAAVLAYGHLRIKGNVTDIGPRIALIQGSIDIAMRYEPGKEEQILGQYFDLSRKAVRGSPSLDLVVWPETMFLTGPSFNNAIVVSEAGARRPPQCPLSDADFRHWLFQAEKGSRSSMSQTAQYFDVPLLLGVDMHRYGADGLKIYNSAVHVARDGRLLGRYDKMHLVPFGEYVPFADRWPWLQRLTPLPISVTAGQKPAAFDLRSRGDPKRSYRIAPNICYETVLPQVIRGQVNALVADGREPDILVNLTNDGWFWGSSELDMHLACSVFRAVECRKPLLVAANTGFSAWIDSNGSVQAKGKRRDTDIILAQPGIDRRRSWYLVHGDWPAGVCLATCILFGLVGLQGIYAPRGLRGGDPTTP